MPAVEPRPHDNVPAELLTTHYLEEHPNDFILIGDYKGVQQPYYIFNCKRDKRDDA